MNMGPCIYASFGNECLLSSSALLSAWPLRFLSLFHFFPNRRCNQPSRKFRRNIKVTQRSWIRRLLKFTNVSRLTLLPDVYRHLFSFLFSSACTERSWHCPKMTTWMNLFYGFQISRVQFTEQTPLMDPTGSWRDGKQDVPCRKPCFCVNRLCTTSSHLWVFVSVGWMAFLPLDGKIQLHFFLFRSFLLSRSIFLKH